MRKVLNALFRKGQNWRNSLLTEDTRKLATLEASVRSSLRTMCLSTVSLIAFDESKQSIGSGSAFVIAIPIAGPGLNHDYVIVTARHVVQPAIVNGREIAILVGTNDDSALIPSQQLQEIHIPNDSWIHGNSDVSIAPLTINKLPINHTLRAINYFDVMGMSGVELRGSGAEVALFGRWSNSSARNVILYRRGTISSEEVPIVRLEIEPKTYSPADVLLVEATVSPGMSGGPVGMLYEPGSDYGALIGLIHGFRRLDEQELRLGDASQYNSNAESERQRITSELSAINSRIVYVIPLADILQTLNQYRELPYYLAKPT